MLNAAKIPYLWTIFTNDSRAIKNENIIYMPPRLDIIDYIANADMLVQFSDCEAYCYSVVEALSVGTPALVTDLPVYHEIGLKNDENGFLVDFDLSNLNITDIYNKALKFKYQPKEDNYKNILDNTPSTYKKELNTYVNVEVIKRYFDLELLKWLEEDIKPIKMNLVRAKELEKKKLVKILEE